MEPIASQAAWKKGSAEWLIPSLVEARPRHGYEISKLIEQRPAGTVRFHVASRHNSIKRVSSGVGEGSMAIAFIHQYLAL
jgi:hypothetical protein